MPHELLVAPLAQGSAARAPRHCIASRESFLALVQLALAEGVEGGKGSSTPQQGGSSAAAEAAAAGQQYAGGLGEEEPLSFLPRWLTLIEQDVTRSYNAGLPFGLTGALLAGKRRVLGPWKQLSVGALEWGDVGALRQLRAAALARWAQGAGGRQGQRTAMREGSGAERKRGGGGSRGASLPPRLAAAAAAAGNRGGPAACRLVFTPLAAASSSSEGGGRGSGGSSGRAVPAAVLHTPTSPSLPQRLRRTSAYADLLLPTSSLPTSGGASASSDASGDSPPSAAVPLGEAEAEAEILRVSLQGVLLGVAALEPALRYTQGMHALGRLCLHVAYEGLGALEAPAEGGGAAHSGCAPLSRARTPSLSSTSVSAVSRARAHSSASASAASLALASSPSSPHGSFTFALLSTLPPRRLGAAVLATNMLAGLLRDGPSGVARLLPLYLPDTCTLRLRLYQMGRLLLRRQPLLHSALTALGVPPSSYASPWLLTLFASFTALDAPAVLRLWDAALCGVGGAGAGWWSSVLGACLAVMDALAPLLTGESVALEDALPPLRTPRLYYEQARKVALEAGGGEGSGLGGGVWRQAYSLRGMGGGGGALGAMECILRYALTSEACRVSAAELEELQANFEAFKHIEDAH